jgi:hypothetical protein
MKKYKIFTKFICLNIVFSLVGSTVTPFSIAFAQSKTAVTIQNETQEDKVRNTKMHCLDLININEEGDKKDIDLVRKNFITMAKKVNLAASSYDQYVSSLKESESDKLAETKERFNLKVSNAINSYDAEKGKLVQIDYLNTISNYNASEENSFIGSKVKEGLYNFITEKFNPETNPKLKVPSSIKDTDFKNINLGGISDFSYLSRPGQIHNEKRKELDQDNIKNGLEPSYIPQKIDFYNRSKEEINALLDIEDIEDRKSAAQGLLEQCSLDLLIHNNGKKLTNTSTDDLLSLFNEKEQRDLKSNSGSDDEVQVEVTCGAEASVVEISNGTKRITNCNQYGEDGVKSSFELMSILQPIDPKKVLENFGNKKYCQVCLKQKFKVFSHYDIKDSNLKDNQVNKKKIKNRMNSWDKKKADAKEDIKQKLMAKAYENEVLKISAITEQGVHAQAWLSTKDSSDIKIEDSCFTNNQMMAEIQKKCSFSKMKSKKEMNKALAHLNNILNPKKDTFFAKMGITASKGELKTFKQFQSELARRSVNKSESNDGECKTDREEYVKRKAGFNKATNASDGANYLIQQLFSKNSNIFSTSPVNDYINSKNKEYKDSSPIEFLTGMISDQIVKDHEIHGEKMMLTKYFYPSDKISDQSKFRNTLIPSLSAMTKDSSLMKFIDSGKNESGDSHKEKIKFALKAFLNNVAKTNPSMYYMLNNKNYFKKKKEAFEKQQGLEDFGNRVESFADFIDPTLSKAPNKQVVSDFNEFKAMKCQGFKENLAALACPGDDFEKQFSDDQLKDAARAVAKDKYIDRNKDSKDEPSYNKADQLDLIALESQSCEMTMEDKDKEVGLKRNAASSFRNINDIIAPTAQSDFAIQYQNQHNPKDAPIKSSQLKKFANSHLCESKEYETYFNCSVVKDPKECSIRKATKAREEVLEGKKRKQLAEIKNKHDAEISKHNPSSSSNNSDSDNGSSRNTVVSGLPKLPTKGLIAADNDLEVVNALKSGGLTEDDFVLNKDRGTVEDPTYEATANASSYKTTEKTAISKVNPDGKTALDQTTKDAFQFNNFIGSNDLPVEEDYTAQKAMYDTILSSDSPKNKISSEKTKTKFLKDLDEELEDPDKDPELLNKKIYELEAKIAKTKAETEANAKIRELEDKIANLKNKTEVEKKSDSKKSPIEFFKEKGIEKLINRDRMLSAITYKENNNLLANTENVSKLKTAAFSNTQIPSSSKDNKVVQNNKSFANNKNILKSGIVPVKSSNFRNIASTDPKLNIATSDGRYINTKDFGEFILKLSKEDPISQMHGIHFKKGGKDGKKTIIQFESNDGKSVEIDLSQIKKTGVQDNVLEKIIAMQAMQKGVDYSKNLVINTNIVKSNILKSKDVLLKSLNDKVVKFSDLTEQLRILKSIKAKSTFN